MQIDQLISNCEQRSYRDGIAFAKSRLARLSIAELEVLWKHYFISSLYVDFGKTRKIACLDDLANAMVHDQKSPFYVEV